MQDIHPTIWYAKGRIELVPDSALNALQIPSKWDYHH
jgi:hypothetical protein